MNLVNSKGTPVFTHLTHTIAIITGDGCQSKILLFISVLVRVLRRNRTAKMTFNSAYAIWLKYSKPHIRKAENMVITHPMRLGVSAIPNLAPKAWRFPGKP